MVDIVVAWLPPVYTSPIFYSGVRPINQGGVFEDFLSPSKKVILRGQCGV
jgi:hypothetical protein